MKEKADQVRFKLIQNCLKYDWLIAQFEKIGTHLTRTELSDILNGRRTSEKAVMVLDKSIELLNRYETVFVNA